jgi:hypothetical protein
MTNFFQRAAAGALLLSLPAMAQGVSSECGLRGADTTFAGGVPGKTCLDPIKLNGKNVVIPANVTRIDNSGFALCESSESTGGAADIVYVLDQSGSMNISYAWISPDKKDTVYLQGTDGCGFRNGDLTGFGTITIPNATTVRTIPVVNPARSITGCTNTSGDPFTQRGVAFKEAIEFQAQRAPSSTAGYMGFSGNVLNPVRPVKLNLKANVDLLERNIVISYGNGTNYTAPMDSAKRWLLNPAISANPTKAVIFLSDGRPSPADQNGLAVIQANYAGQPGAMPPVYGILLGKPSADTIMLDSISRATGGKFFLIPPSRPDSLSSVVAQILNVILRTYHPVSAVVTNNSTAPASVGSAGAANFSRQNDTSWLLNLDKNVPLNKSAANQMRVFTHYVDQLGAPRDTTVNFVLTTTGPDASGNLNLTNTPFSVVCIELPPPPPPVDVVKVAYIKDTDGDGAGDLVVIVFTKPLAALPASLDAYWNNAGPSFKNKAAPVLSFLTASGNTVVLADFSASPFPVGMTGIPDGGAPVAVLPPGGVFGAQTPAIQDSIGPMLVKATIKPYNPLTAQPGSDLNIDTITISTSEPIRSRGQWTTVLLWSKSVNGKCEDFVHAIPVVPAHNPVQDVGLTSVTVQVSASSGLPTPSKGDCVYLNVDADRTYTDMKFNLPSLRGVILEGPARPNQIELFRGYPPVVGLDPDNASFQASVQDSRDSSKGGYATEIAPGKYQVNWIPPVGFHEGGALPVEPPGTAVVDKPLAVESQGPVKMPPGIAALQVVSTGKYIADVRIFDNKGLYLRHFQQHFGYDGEMGNLFRASRYQKGQISYLAWDLKDDNGHKAGQGVYVWKVLFRFENGKQEVRYTRTGVVRGQGWDVP